MNEAMNKSFQKSRGSLGQNSKMSYNNFNKEDMKKENIQPYVSEFISLIQFLLRIMGNY
jgi:hypothetical protein